MWANDPSLLAYAEAMRIQQFDNGIESSPSLDANDVHLLSIGTGRAQFSLSPPVVPMQESYTGLRELPT